MDTQTKPRDQIEGVVANWPKNGREHFRVSLDSFHGRDLIAIRVWFTAENGVDRPTKSGVAVAVRHLPKIADAFNKALVEARARGLIEADDEVGA